MQFDGAKITEQGVTFGIVIVKPHVLRDVAAQNGVRRLGSTAFGRVPIVLMAQDSRGIPTYHGDPNIVGFLSHVLVEQIPWKRYSFN